MVSADPGVQRKRTEQPKTTIRQQQAEIEDLKKKLDHMNEILLNAQRARFGQSSVADVMTKKYVDGLPLARQEKIWARQGVELSRATLANWVIQCTQTWLKPLYRHMKQALLEDTLSGDGWLRRVQPGSERYSLRLLGPRQKKMAGSYAGGSNCENE